MPDDEMYLESYSDVVETAIKSLIAHDVVSRIWKNDQTVWEPATKIGLDRLGWLTINDQMILELPALRSFASDVRSSGIEYVVLLAMGGSAFAPGLYHATLTKEPGYPTLLVLDSTLPEQIKLIENTIVLQKTLFVVASKSGSTIEVQSLYRYFRGRLDEELGSQSAGAHFIAITDEGTPLEKLSHEESFLKLFKNPTNIGGRFSGFSFFGLVPATLAGINLDPFLDGVNIMSQDCRLTLTSSANRGAFLGASIAAMANMGVDKLTLIASPALHDLGLWVEQMIAESLGKDYKGIIPAANEPFENPIHYSSDRFFVYIRLLGDNNSKTDKHVKALLNNGKPLIQLNMSEMNQLGGEMFRWSFATIIAGHLLMVNPFDQPNVQEAKDFTVETLNSLETDKELNDFEVPISLDSLLDNIKPGKYFALLVYLSQSPEVDSVLQEIRSSLLRRKQIATTSGYGPRYLHSTGQLHKGGPQKGVFLQIVSSTGEKLIIPGEKYDFRVLVDSQARGDMIALQKRGAPVARLELSGNQVMELEQLAQSIDRKLMHA